MSKIPSLQESWRSTLPQRVIQYVEDIYGELEADIGKDKIVSIMLFGSLARSEKVSSVSDVDIIIVLSDSVSKKEMRRLDKILMDKEIEFGFREKVRTTHDIFIQQIEQMTGMFLSHFVCKEEDILSGNFGMIFNVNMLLSELLAPSSIVLEKIKREYIVLYGEDVFSRSKKLKIRRADIVKSMLMNILLSSGAMLIYNFSKSATKFSLESIKWSLLSCHFSMTGSSENISNITLYFRERSKKKCHKKYLDKFIQLREDYMPDVEFVLQTPLIVFFVHLYTLNQLSDNASEVKTPVD